jgi:hypothetical protein
MSAINQQFIRAALFFLFIFIFGYWLRFSGKPYNTLLITIHKLIGLGMGIYLGMRVNEVRKGSPLGTGEITSIVVTVLLFVALVASGSLLSAEKEMPGFVKVIHELLPYLTILSTGVTLYLLG